MDIAAVKTRVEQKLGALNDISNTRWIAMAQDLNELLYQEMIDIEPSRFVTTQSYTVTSSPQTHALPAALQGMSQFDGGFHEIDANGNDVGVLVQTGYGSQRKGYYIDGSDVVFTGITTSTVVRLRYIPTLTAMSAMSSEFVVPDRYKELVVQGMIKAYYEEYEDVRQYDADAKFARLLGQFLSSLPRATKVYSIDPHYSSY